MNREPSVFPVAPATVFPADSKPGVPDGFCDQRGAPMSTSAEEVIARSIGSQYGAGDVLEALTAAGFVLVPPNEGWRVVKLTDNNVGANGIARITEELR